MGKDFRFNKSEWEENDKEFSYKRGNEQRQRKADQKRKDKLRNPH